MILLDYSEVKGSSNVGSYKNCTIINSVDFTIGKKGHNTDFVNRRRDFSYSRCTPILIGRETDSASASIVSSAIKRQIKDAKIYFLGTDNFCYLEISLKDCCINDYKFSCHGGSDSPSETFYLTFNEIIYRYIPDPKSGKSPYSATLDLEKAIGG